jgi:hypothetical protein
MTSRAVKCTKDVVNLVPERGSYVGNVGEIPWDGDTLSGSRFSDGAPSVRPLPGMPKSGQFRNKGTIRRFPGTYHDPIGILPAWKKIRANIRYWTAKVLLSRAIAQDHEKKGGFGIVSPEGTNYEKIR